MEHRRIASFGVYSLLLAATTALAAPGPYRGMYVCPTMTGAPGIFRIPIDLVVRNGNVEFARPLLNWNGTRVTGNEMASGTIDADGKVHLTSAWFNGGIIFHADYNGTLTPNGGTLMGTQAWHSARGPNGSRTCTAALVQLAATNSVATTTIIARSIAATTIITGSIVAATIITRSIAVSAVSTGRRRRKC